MDANIKIRYKPIPIAYLDCLAVKIRLDINVINKAVYLALDVNIEGHKKLLREVAKVERGSEVLVDCIDRTSKPGHK